MEPGNNGVYRAVFEQAPDAMILLNSEGIISLLNIKALEITGCRGGGELTGKNISGLISEPDRDRFTEFLKQGTTAGGGAPGRFGVQALDGTIKICEFLTAPVTANTGIPCDVVVTFRDVTGRARAENALNAAVVFLNRLDSITRHDIMNQLTILLGYLELSHDMVTDPTLKEFLKREEGAAETIRKQVAFTKEYQNVGVNPPAWTDIAAVIRETAGVIEHPGLKVEVAVLPGLKVFVDPIIRKIISNLIENAVIHGKTATEIRVTSGEGPGGFVIAFTDNGAGVPQENKELIFNRGFGAGRGYGLFLARDILALTGMTIAETGEPGKGARIEITVPKGGYRLE